MEPELQNALDALSSLVVREQVIYIICQTLLFGIHLCLAPIAIHAMVTNGLQSRARKWLLTITTSMFALMTVYWIIYVIFTFQQVDLWNNAVTACYGTHNALSCIVGELQPKGIVMADWLVMSENILLVNYLIADGVVVWRAWVLCFDQSRVVLMIQAIMLGINTIIYLMSVAARASRLSLISKHPDLQSFGVIDHMINVTQVAYLMLSVLINIFATSIIALKAWKYRKLLIESGIGIRTPRQAIRILAILVESGMIYILLGLTSVVSIFILMSFRTDETSTLIALVGIQLVGIYPIVVILLVEKNRSLNSTYSSFGTIIDGRGDRPQASQLEPMAFASGSVLASGEETDSVPKLPHTTAHAMY